MSEVTAALVLLGMGGLVYALHNGTQKNTGGNRNGARNNGLTRYGARNNGRKRNGARNATTRVVFASQNTRRNSAVRSAVGNDIEKSTKKFIELLKQAKHNGYSEVQQYLDVVLNKDKEFIKNFFSYRDGGCLMFLLKHQQYDMIHSISAMTYIFDIIVTKPRSPPINFGQFLYYITSYDIHINQLQLPDEYRNIKVSTILFNFLPKVYYELELFLKEKSRYNRQVVIGDVYNDLLNGLSDYDCTINDLVGYIQYALNLKINDGTLVLNDLNLTNFFIEYNQLLHIIYNEGRTEFIIKYLKT